MYTHHRQQQTPQQIAASQHQPGRLGAHQPVSRVQVGCLVAVLGCEVLMFKGGDIHGVLSRSCAGAYIYAAVTTA